MDQCADSPTLAPWQDTQLTRGAAPSRAARPPRLAHGGAVQRRPEQTGCPQRNELRRAARAGTRATSGQRSRTPSGDDRRGAARVAEVACNADNLSSHCAEGARRASAPKAPAGA
eukprot:scaffold99336_cov28-Phaeocystis_antarctica.AAC.2